MSNEVFKEFLSELSAFGDKAKTWLKSEAIKIESELAPLVKEIAAAGLQIAEQDALQIGTKAAADFASGKSEKDVLSGIEANVRIALPVLATQESTIALQGIVASIAASAKQQNAANPVNNTNG